MLAVLSDQACGVEGLLDEGPHRSEIPNCQMQPTGHVAPPLACTQTLVVLVVSPGVEVDVQFNL